jgi:hypothetical protein
METFYAYCAAIGAALLLGQLLLSLLGFGGHDLDVGHDVDFHAGLDGLHGDVHTDHFDRGGHWFVGLLSFRAVVSALAVFGLVGMGLNREFVPPRPAATFVIALAAGGGMMYVVAWLLRRLYDLRSDGTVRIERTVGLTGATYLTIPAKKAGAGKVTMKIQNRIMEFSAVTSGAEIPTGAPVVVLGVLSPQIIEVAPAVPASEQTLAGHTHV